MTIKRLGEFDKQCPIDIQPVIHNSNPTASVIDLFQGVVFPQE